MNIYQHFATVLAQLLRHDTAFRFAVTSEMISSMRQPANPDDNASCESDIKTLRREEIFANRYRDLGHLRRNMERFIEQYYNRLRLHSALGYRPLEEFEHVMGSEQTAGAAAMT